MTGLEGKRVVLTGSRKLDELSAIVRNQGGTPVLRPMQGKVVIDDADVDRAVNEFLDAAYDWVIFTTGIGLEILHQASIRIRAEEAFLKKLRDSWIAARGYKTIKYLKILGLEPSIRDDDGTTAGLIRAFPHQAVNGCRVALQLYGETAPRLTKWLAEEGAHVESILPYTYSEPNSAEMDQLVQEILDASVDAVTFTSTPQVRHLFEFARKRQIYNQLLQSFTAPVVAVAVGKVTAEALKEEGVQRVVAPDLERMGSMIVELAKFYAESHD